MGFVIYIVLSLAPPKKSRIGKKATFKKAMVRMLSFAGAALESSLTYGMHLRDAVMGFSSQIINKV